MPYTESHAELAQHPKTKRLARQLGVSIPTALGHLHLLWHFALKYAQDGNLSRFDPADIADGAMWEGDPETLVVALEETGWLQARLVHDWHEYGGKYLDRKERNAERMRQARAQAKQGTNKERATHVQRTSRACVQLEKSREEKSTKKEDTSSSQPRSAALNGQSGPKVPREPNPLWDALCDAFGYRPQTATERSRFGKVVKELHAAGALPEEIPRRSDAYKRLYPGAAFTPEALVKHWSALAVAPKKPAPNLNY